MTSSKPALERQEDGGSDMADTTYVLRTVVDESGIQQSVETRSAEETKWYLRGLRKGRLLGMIDAKDAAEGKLDNVTIDVLIRDNSPKELLREITKEEARGHLYLGD